MARIDDLPADQQAVLRLLLRAEPSSYDEIARALKMAPAAVRDRAHDAAMALGPDGSHVPRERRAHLADYLLRQQPEAEARATRAALDRSAAERGWARIVAGELRPLAQGDLPPIPGAERDPSAAGAPEPEPAPSGAARARSSRRGGALLLGALGVLAALAIGFFVGRASKDSSSSAPAKTTTTAAKTTVEGQATLTPPAGSTAGSAKGVIQFATSGGQRGIVLRAQGLPVIPKNAGYPVWLTGAGRAPVLLGILPGPDAQGNAVAIGQIQVDPHQYTTVIVGRRATKQPAAPGTGLLTGPIVFKQS